MIQISLRIHWVSHIFPSFHHDEGTLSAMTSQWLMVKLMTRGNNTSSAMLIMPNVGQMMKKQNARVGPGRKTLTLLLTWWETHKFLEPQVYNVVVAMVNLGQFPDMPEYQDVRSNIQAHVIMAIGQTVVLAKRAQAVISTSVSSSCSHHRHVSQHPSRSCHN